MLRGSGSEVWGFTLTPGQTRSARALSGIALGRHSGYKIGEWSQGSTAVIETLLRYRINTFLQIPEKFEAVSSECPVDIRQLTESWEQDRAAPYPNVTTSQRRPSAVHTVLHLGLWVPFVATHHHGEGVRLACLGSRCRRDQSPLPQISPRLHRSRETNQGVYSHRFL